MFAWVIPLLNAVAAIPKIASFVEGIAAQIALWWVKRQNKETIQEVVDAGAIALRAKSKEDRLNADEAWAKALSRPRVSS